MDISFCVRRLRRSAETIRSLVDGTSIVQARWRPGPRKWSILEVVNHLADEEREDFRARIDVLIHRPEMDFTPIDPEGWALQRDYNSRDLRTSLRDFLRERDRSIEWLRNLGEVSWSTTKSHPVAGTLRAGDLLASWMVHDVLHVRQLAALQRAWIDSTMLPFSSDYASPS
jgi:hypothetical protein